MGVAKTDRPGYRWSCVRSAGRVSWHNRREPVVSGDVAHSNHTHTHMNTKMLSPFVVAAALVATGARAVAADTVALSPTEAASPAQPAVAPALALPTPNQIVYVPRLPTAQEITNAAAAQNIAIDQIQQTSTQVIAVYRYGAGQTNVVSYQVLPTATAGVPVTTTQAPTVVYQQQPTTTVVYQSAPRVVYYSDPVYYPNYYWWPGPVSVSLGLGYGWGGHWGGGYRGGYHGGYHGGGHGGHRW